MTQPLNDQYRYNTSWLPQEASIPDYNLTCFQEHYNILLKIETYGSTTLRQKHEKIKNDITPLLVTSCENELPPSFRPPYLLLHAFFIHGTFATFLSGMIQLAKLGAAIGVIGAFAIPILLPLVFTLPYLLYKLYGRDINTSELQLKTKALALKSLQNQLDALARQYQQENNYEAENLERPNWRFFIDGESDQLYVLPLDDAEARQNALLPAHKSRGLFNSTSLHSFYLSGNVVWLILAFSGVVASSYFMLPFATLLIVTLAAYTYAHHRAVVKNNQFKAKLAQQQLQITQVRDRLFKQPTELEQKLGTSETTIATCV